MSFFAFSKEQKPCKKGSSQNKGCTKGLSTVGSNFVDLEVQLATNSGGLLLSAFTSVYFLSQAVFSLEQAIQRKV